MSGNDSHWLVRHCKKYNDITSMDKRRRDRLFPGLGIQGNSQASEQTQLFYKKLPLDLQSSPSVD